MVVGILREEYKQWSIVNRYKSPDEKGEISVVFSPPKFLGNLAVLLYVEQLILGYI